MTDAFAPNGEVQIVAQVFSAGQGMTCTCRPNSGTPNSHEMALRRTVVIILV
jgi:hypothetical protein